MERPLSTRNHLSIEYLRIDDIRPDPRNPRVHDKSNVMRLCRSIKTFGFNVPVLVDKNNKILAGHGRVLACQKLGWDTIPVIRVEHLTPEQADAYRIADNRLTEISKWDEELLGEILVELTAVDLDFDIEVIGFSMAEIDITIEGL